MACFVIQHSSKHPDGNGSIFQVIWRGSEIRVGEIFELYDAGHWWSLPVTKVTLCADGAEIISTFTIGFDGQFDGAVVNTELPRYEGRFRFETT